MARNNRTSSRPSFNKSNSSTQRPHSTSATAATPPVTATPVPPVIQVQSGGILSNILQTAAGVAVGHTVGRMVSGLFEGGNSSPNVDNSVGNSVSNSTGNPVGNTVDNYSSQNTPIQCQGDTKRFLDCMQKNYDDVSACQSYLEMMKQCQRQFAQ